ncbi:hypothetical protein V1264_002938 [Littorina saxatilis]|uniref:Prenylcysteine lyase domain-containing protein n=2 Tax=Littorina saxatilis TaxID=31220 RepID=A0AAN9B6C5_9CAEN
MFSTPVLSFMLQWNAAKASCKLLPVLHASLHTGTEANETCKCGIIGGGLSGTSAAYYLRQLWGDKPLHVDIFEPQRVGGRLALVNVDGQDYEAGGAIIHPRNWHMAFFADHFGLGRRTINKRTHGLYNNEKGLYFQTSPWAFLSNSKVKSRYGGDIERFHNLVADTLLSFDRIYEHLYKIEAFTTVENLLRSMDERFLEQIHTTAAVMFKDAGFSDRFINEIVKGSLITNYSQTLHAPAFLSSISMAGAEPGSWSIQGGLRRLPEKFLEVSGATLIPGEVTHVFQKQSPNRTVSYEVGYKKAEHETGREKYDIIIIATPLDPGREKQIHFEDFPGGLDLPKIPYHPLQVLFTHGKMNESFFGKKSVPTHIMATETDVFFNRMAKQSPVNSGGVEEKEGYGVWKLYLNKTPTEEQLHSVFDDRNDLCLMHWRAFPEYTTTMELPPFVLHDRLYYANAIEVAASAMEMAVVGGRNVANLAFNQWFGHSDRIDSVNSTSSLGSTDDSINKFNVAFYK